MLCSSPRCPKRRCPARLRARNGAGQRSGPSDAPVGAEGRQRSFFEAIRGPRGLRLRSIAFAWHGAAFAVVWCSPTRINPLRGQTRRKHLALLSTRLVFSKNDAAPAGKARGAVLEVQFHKSIPAGRTTCTRCCFALPTFYTHRFH